MKSLRFLLSLLLVLVLAASAFYLFDNRASTAQEYQALLTKARESITNGEISDGVDYYQQALDLYQTEQIYLEVGNAYLEADDLRSAEQWYTEELAVQYPDSSATYEFGLEVYIASEDYEEAFDVYDICLERGASSDKIETLVDTIYYQYKLSGSYTAVGYFSDENGYVAVQYGDKWGYLSDDGSKKLDYLYQAAGVFGTYAPVIDADGTSMLIDETGSVWLDTTCFEEGLVETLHSVWDGLILVDDGETWSYYSAESYEWIFGNYAGATPIVNGVGAVTEDGAAWALIGSDGQLLTGYDYQQVLVNSQGAVYCTDALLVEQNGQFWLVDTQGQIINETGYDSACAFEKDGWAAVQKDGRWIFVNGAGEERDLGDFDEAHSFSNGLAAVSIDGQWGYINLEGNLVIDCIFDDAALFGPNGLTFVQFAQDGWKLLALYRYHH